LQLSTVHGSQVFSIGCEITLFTSAIRLAKAGIWQQMEFQGIKAKQLHTELEFLRAQINPHFLFNTLNNLYALAQEEKDSATADAIARLSHFDERS
jgi:two-component system, LytTR family, sensor kinase